MARPFHGQQPTFGQLRQGGTVGVQNDLVLIPMDHEYWTRNALGQVGCALLGQLFPPGSRHEHLGCRLESPTDGVLGLLSGVWFAEHATEEELEESSMVAQPVVGVVLLPVEVFVEFLLEDSVRRVLERFPGWERNGRSDENRRRHTLRWRRWYRCRPARGGPCSWPRSIRSVAVIH